MKQVSQTTQFAEDVKRMRKLGEVVAAWEKSERLRPLTTDWEKLQKLHKLNKDWETLQKFQKLQGVTPPQGD